MNLKDKTLWQRNAAAIGGMVLFAARNQLLYRPRQSV